MTGKPPFEADNVLAKLKAHAEHSLPSLTTLRSDVPTELAKVVAKMMAKNPAERFQTPAEVAEALAPIAKPAASPPKRRVRTLVAAAALFALLAGVIFVQTDKGRIEIQSDVDDIEVAIKQGGKVIEIIDAQTGSQIKWLSSGKYDVELKGDRNDIEISKDGFKLTRWGKEIVTLKRKPVTSDVAAKSDWKGWAKDAPPPAIAPFNAEQAKQHQEAWAKHLGVPVEYTNSIGMKFRLIPPGEFTMGSTPEEIEEGLKAADGNTAWRRYLRSEGSQHKVSLTQPIFLGVHEVTQRQYMQVMGMNPSEFAPTGARKDSVVGLDTARFPVEMVSWNDAAEFCAKLSLQEKLKANYLRTGETVSRLEGNGYRLPSEAEWEFACRGGTTTKYWNGNNDQDLPQVAWFGAGDGVLTRAVGELKANPLGLFDVHGNVWEWTQDEWEPTYYEQFQAKTAIDPRGPSTADSQRVIRGGYWHFGASSCRSSFRFAYDPTHRWGSIGLRVALPVDAVRQAIEQWHAVKK